MRTIETTNTAREAQLRVDLHDLLEVIAGGEAHMYVEHSFAYVLDEGMKYRPNGRNSYSVTSVVAVIGGVVPTKNTETHKHLTFHWYGTVVFHIEYIIVLALFHKVNKNGIW